MGGNLTVILHFMLFTHVLLSFYCKKKVHPYICQLITFFDFKIYHSFICRHLVFL